jgi:hypothetical protein
VQGRISKNDIDARMLKALADLPVDLGIEAVDKFAMASLDSVRSKTGFMVSGCMCPWMVTGINRTQALTALLWQFDAHMLVMACRWALSSVSRRISPDVTADATLMTGAQWLCFMLCDSACSAFTAQCLAN